MNNLIYLQSIIDKLIVKYDLTKLRDDKYNIYYVKNYRSDDYNNAYTYYINNIKKINNSQEEHLNFVNNYLKKNPTSFSYILKYNKIYNYLEFYRTHTEFKQKLKNIHTKYPYNYYNPYLHINYLDIDYYNNNIKSELLYIGHIYIKKEKTNIFKTNKNLHTLMFNNKKPNYLSLKNWRYLFIDDEETIKKDLLKLSIKKDWIDNLSINSYNISNKEARKINSINELIEHLTGIKYSNRLLFRFDPYKLIRLSTILDRSSMERMKNFVLDISKQNNNYNFILNLRKLTYTQLIILYFNFKFKNNTYNEIIKVLNTTDNRNYININYTYIEDYIRMCVQENIKISLNFKSINRIKYEHDKLVKQQQLSSMLEIKPNKIYNILKNDLNNNLIFTFIDNKEDLYNEGFIMNHCVASYANKINKGNSGIYHINYKNTPYTLELCYGSTGYFNTETEISEQKSKHLFISQLKAKYNGTPPNELINLIQEQLDLINIQNNIKFTNVEEGFYTSQEIHEFI